MLIFFCAGIFCLFTILCGGSILKRMSLKQSFLSSLGAALSSAGFYVIGKYFLPLFEDGLFTQLINPLSSITKKLMYIFIALSALFLITGIFKLIHKIFFEKKED